MLFRVTQATLLLRFTQTKQTKWEREAAGSESTGPRAASSVVERVLDLLGLFLAGGRAELEAEEIRERMSTETRKRGVQRRRRQRPLRPQSRADTRRVRDKVRRKWMRKTHTI